MNIDRLLQQSEGSASIPPVDTWQPALSGEMDILIQEDGSWLHEGSRLLVLRLPSCSPAYCVWMPMDTAWSLPWSAGALP